MLVFTAIQGVLACHQSLNLLFQYVHCTGDVMLERISPQIIVLDPPEKLVIEARASGGYGMFDWSRNQNPFTLTQGEPFTVTLQEFVNFFEIFVREPTTTNDLGEYDVDLPGGQVSEIGFIVTPYSKYRCNFMCCV